MLSKKIVLIALFLSGVVISNAQQNKNQEYIKVSNERAAKIVEKLALNDTEKEKKITQIIAEQYQNLNAVQEKRDAEIKKVKDDSSLAKEKQNAEIEKLKSKADKSIDKLHKTYLKKLGTQLNE